MDYQDELRRVVSNAISKNSDCLFGDVYRETEGADPREVRKLFDEIKKDSNAAIPASAPSVRITHEYPNLPASNPILAQWWFRQDSATFLARLAFKFSQQNTPAGFLGAPTVAHVYSYEYGVALLLDADPDIDVTSDLNDNKSRVIHFATGDTLPSDIENACSSVVVDPPWYEDSIRDFLIIASQMVMPYGSVFCSLPPRLTRPTIADERARLLNWVTENDFQIVSLEPGRLIYLVPTFESKAFSDVGGFDNRPWRHGDLLHVRYCADAPIKQPLASTQPSFTTYTRVPQRFRVFLRNDIKERSLFEHLEAVHDFQRNVSRRAYNLGDIDIWTTNNRGCRVQNPTSVQLALDCWQKGIDQDRTQTILVTKLGLKKTAAVALISALHSQLEVWDEAQRSESYPSELMLEKAVLESCKPKWVATASSRPYEVQGDGFRLMFQRDRDRIVWSNGLRRLANKTQVFSTQQEGNVRQRLAHSIEVTQLAMTIGRQFGLHPDLIEAGGMAHDIGHTPFGHAGEFALNRILEEIDPKLCGFSHYEHGVDLVRWLEDVYQPPASGGFPGLNLTPEVAECIFKHMFFKNGHSAGQAELYKKSKHRTYFNDSFCHLEGQCIRVADKVSYLISDLEDGIRMGVFELTDLLGCHLFNIPPIDLLTGEEGLFERFISQRRLIIKVVMEDIILATDQRLSQLGGRDDVRSATDYVVNFSESMHADFTEVWKKLQKGKLHQDSRVTLANVHSAQIVERLFTLFTFFPDLVDPAFLTSHNRLNKTEYIDFYRTCVGNSTVELPTRLRSLLPLASIIGKQVAPKDVPLENLVLSKDYVASLTDSVARELHSKYILGQ